MQSQSDNSALLLRVSEVARRLSISRSRAYELVANGTIPGVVRLGSSVRVRKADLEAWVAALGSSNEEATGATWQGQPAATVNEEGTGERTTSVR